MTLIVGGIDKKTGKVYIGGDGGASCLNQCISFKRPKVFKIADYLFGCAISYRAMQVIEHNFNPPHPENLDLDTFIHTRFIESLKQVFIDFGLVGKESVESGNNEDISNSNILIGIRGRLFFIDINFGILEPCENYHALGNEDIALGVMYATENTKFSMKKRIRLALEAGVKFSASVKEPFTILSVE